MSNPLCRSGTKFLFIYLECTVGPINSHSVEDERDSRIFGFRDEILRSQKDVEVMYFVVG